MVKRVLTCKVKRVILFLPNKRNIQSFRGIFFLGISTPFCGYTFTDEFDKMQIPYGESVLIYPKLYIVCLATTGVCVFVR